MTGGTGTIVSGQNDSTSSSIDPSTVEAALANANLTLNADNSIVISSAITWTSATTLTLSTNSSGSAIDIGAPISGINGGLTINTKGAGDAIAASGSVNVGTFILQNGTWAQDSATLPAFSARNFELSGSSNFIRIAGFDSNNNNAEEITDVYGLQGLGSPDQLNIPAELLNNIDASGTASWNSGAGFVPIGSNAAPYSATFNGMGHTVNGLTINTPTVAYVGLFGEMGTATLENVGVTNAQISGAYDVGGLVGSTNGAGSNISDVYVSGAITSSGFESVGGITGYNSGTITNAYSTANVNAAANVTYVGGLVGYNIGTINEAYSSGLVNAGAGSTNVGGLVGFNGHTVVNSFWDTTTSGQTSSSGGTGETTATLLNASTYLGAGWSIGTDPTADTWVILTGQTRPMLGMEYSTTITNAHQLQLIDLNATTLATGYTVANNIDATGTSNASDVWGTSTTNGGAGFVPIGTTPAGYTGTFNGQGNVIDGLYINAPGATGVGLFGTVGSVGRINQVDLTNVQVSGMISVGGLVGANTGIVSNSYSSGTITSGSGGFYVGGLVGDNEDGTINNSYSSAAVSGFNIVGGLAGYDRNSSVSNSYSTGR